MIVVYSRWIGLLAYYQTFHAVEVGKQGYRKAPIAPQMGDSGLSLGTKASLFAASFMIYQKWDVSEKLLVI